MRKFTFTVVLITVMLAASALLFAAVDPDYWGYACDRYPGELIECAHGGCQDPGIVADPIYGTNCAATCDGIYMVEDCNKKCILSVCVTSS